MTAKARIPPLARPVLRCVGIVTLALTSASMSACVLPIAPEFQDPPTAQNYAPIILDSDPPQGSAVMSATFTVVVTDPNVADDLYVRWIIDYPPDSANTRVLVSSLKIAHSVDGRPLNQPVTVTIDCVLGGLAKIAQHQVLVVVADRPFLPPQPPQNVLALVEDPGFAVQASWTLNLECP
jgi:hypothetical protein